MNNPAGLLQLRQAIKDYRVFAEKRLTNSALDYARYMDELAEKVIKVGVWTNDNLE